MGIDWKSRRTLVVAVVVVAVLLVVSISQGAFRTWDGFDYFGWWVALPLLLLVFAALITFLARAWGTKRD
jgi:uncharacterized membrane protein